MGYVTLYVFLINAHVDRRKILAQQIAVCAGKPLLPEIAINSFKEEINSAVVSSVMSFDRKWWYDILKDFQGSWWDEQYQVIRDGITLLPGESIHLTSSGENDSDRWKISAEYNFFKYEKAVRVEYVDINEHCANDDIADENEIDIDDDENALYKCAGCSSCATVVPIYN